MARRTSSASSSSARPANARARRSADRMLQMAQETFGRSETASVLDQLTGTNGFSEALQTAEVTRTSDHMPARTVSRFLTGMACGGGDTSIDDVTKAVKLLNGVCNAVDASDKLTREQSALIKSALTGKGTTRAFRAQFIK